MSEWTKGPWFVNGHDIENPDDRPAFPGVIDGSGKAHGENFVCNTFGNSDTCKANAHLIAAAPELYEALDDLRIWVADNHIVPTNLFADVEYALAKARGEHHD